MSGPVHVVITTIQEPTPSIRRLVAALSEVDGVLIVIGDKKGPARFDVERSELVSLEAQQRLSFSLARLLPTGHYARKNLGYLLAMSRGAGRIFETDDDNAPLGDWGPRDLLAEAQTVEARPWLNVYRLFCEELIWPRGFPLRLVRDEQTYRHDRGAALKRIEAPIQQGLVDGSPDVDAVWRLTLDREFIFTRRLSVRLLSGTWCPFNSQCTWWWPVAFPLMYLPSHCTFRMTDIWRSFVAQRCLWELGYGIVFHASEMFQERNYHDLMRDFHDEIPGYEGNERLVSALEKVSLQQGRDAVGANLLRCYEALVSERFFPQEELALVRAWLKDLAVLSCC